MKDYKIYIVLILCSIILGVCIILSRTLLRYEYIPEINAIFDKLSGNIISR